MAVIETSIFIDASPEDVFDFAANNPERIPETLEPSAAYPEVGGQLRVTYKAAGVTLKTTGTVTENIPGQRFAAHYEGMATGTQTWTYTPEGDGTRVTLHFDYEMAGGGIGKIVDKLIVERQNATNFEQSLRNLKVLMEG